MKSIKGIFILLFLLFAFGGGIGLSLLFKSGSDATLFYIAYIVLSIFCGSGLYFLLKIIIFKRIDALVVLSRDVATGNFTKVPGEIKNDEIGLLQRVYNIMIDELESSQKMMATNSLELQTMRESNQRIIDTISQGVVSTNEQGVIVSVNSYAEILLKGDSYTLVGEKNIFDFFILKDGVVVDCGADIRNFKEYVAVHQRCTMPMEYQIKLADGSRIPVEISYQHLDDDQYSEGHHLFIIKDVSAEEDAKRENSLAQNVFSHAGDAIVITDEKSKILSFNKAYEEMTGFSRDEIIEINPSIVKSSQHDAAFYFAMWNAVFTQGLWSGELWDSRKNGEIYPRNITISAIKNSRGKTTNYIGISKDISIQKKLEKKLEDMAFFDQLTGLSNRSLLLDKVETAIHQSHQHQRFFALLFLDLDRFKGVNDTLGHDVGDILLKQVSERITSCLEEEDTAARLGGDEFVVLLNEVTNANDVQVTAQSIVDILGMPFSIRSNTIEIGVSIGVVIYPVDGTGQEELFKKADIAMYNAKESGRGIVKFFAEKMNSEVKRKQEIEKALKVALSNKEFELYYQPKIDIEKQSIYGFEALIRWTSKTIGSVPPDQFIPLAEEIGLIEDIGEWVMHEACKGAHRLRTIFPECSVSINLSPRQIDSRHFLQTVENIIRSTQIPIEAIEFEITETALIKDFELTQIVVSQLRNMGCTVSLDDFGTGYSSLSYLNSLNIDILKIDKSFIDHVPDPKDASSGAMVQAMVYIAEKLNLKVVAEGVETEEQLTALKIYGCGYGQGYLWSKPLPLSDIEGGALADLF
ncbi:MAG: EAL domain-containing protein [Fibrobacterales bacterium]